MLKRNSFLLGIVIITIALVLTSFLIVKHLSIVKTNKKIVSNYIANTSIKTIHLYEREKEDNSKYIAVLEIPKINLKRGLTYDNKLNDIKYNIQILDGDMPNINKGNFILASHSGNSDVSFFSGLSKLENSSDIIVYYDGYKYVYKLSNSYEMDITGRAEIIRDRTKNTITLITCSETNNNKQIVYIAYFAYKTTY